jgi:chromosome segregation ATPase
MQTNFGLPRQRLARVLVNNEVSEASNKVVLQELQDTRSSLSRLTSQHTKCAGLESRLARVTVEKEDVQQERDSANQRTRVAEARVVSLRDRVSRLQEQLTALHTELDQHRSHRLELSEEISQGARSQLEAWLRSNVGFSCLSIILFHAYTPFRPNPTPRSHQTMK